MGNDKNMGEKYTGERHTGEIMEDLWTALKKCEFPVHGFLAERGGRLIKEEYRTPYERNDLHRMFSITKSFCSLAVGFLYEEGRLSLEDRIVDYFPEYCEGKIIHPWLGEMTIRHMLSMETCYSSTTYKLDSSKNWVESFFITPPTHRSGQIFLYDTSSSHTLAALVKKLTGKGVLDYLREKCLDKIGFSREAYILADPFGSEMGGSGLMALPADLLKLGRYCMDTVLRGEGKFADYLREAVSFQVPTVHTGQTVDEQQGYGYMFWRIRNGFSMFGMGGQYLLFYPEEDMIFVITADTQKIKGGNQRILDLVHEAMGKVRESVKKDMPLCNRVTAALTGSASYRLCDNPSGFQKLFLSIDDLKGNFILFGQDTDFEFPFSFEKPTVSVLAEYNERIAVQALWADDQTLYLPVQIVGESVGSLHFMLRLSEEKVTVWMHKIEETYFHEFQGFLEGKRES